MQGLEEDKNSKICCVFSRKKCPFLRTYLQEVRRSVSYGKQSLRKGASYSMARPRKDIAGTKPALSEIANDKSGKFFEKTLTPQQFIDGCEEYFKICDERGKKLRIVGLCKYLGISEETLMAWAKAGDGKAKKDGQRGIGGIDSAYVWPIKKAMYEIRDRLEQENTPMAVFLLKQAPYGGYTDRPAQATQGGNTTIVLSFGEVHKNTARNYGK